MNSLISSCGKMQMNRWLLAHPFSSKMPHAHCAVPLMHDIMMARIHSVRFHCVDHHLQTKVQVTNGIKGLDIDSVAIVSERNVLDFSRYSKGEHHRDNSMLDFLSTISRSGCCFLLGTVLPTVWNHRKHSTPLDLPQLSGQFQSDIMKSNRPLYSPVTGGVATEMMKTSDENATTTR